MDLQELIQQLIIKMRCENEFDQNCYKILGFITEELRNGLKISPGGVRLYGGLLN